MKRRLLLILITVFILFGCSVNNKDNTDKPISYIENASKAELSGKYDFIENSDNFMEIKVEDLKEALNSKGTAIVFIGFPDCLNCQKIVPEIQKSAVKNNQTVYYLDHSRFSKEDYFDMLAILDKYQPDEMHNILPVPYIFAFKEGIIVQTVYGYTQDYNYSKVMNFEYDKNIKKINEQNK